MSIKGNLYNSNKDISDEKWRHGTSTFTDLQNTQDIEECELVVKCMYITEKIPLLVFANKAKIANLNEINLLLEVVESWIFENKKTSQKDYQSEQEKFFTKKKITTSEQLIDVEDEQVKIINLVKMGSQLVLENAQDFRILRVILTRSKTYQNEILRQNELGYQKSLKSLINWTLSNIPTFFAETSESKNIDKLQLHKDFNSFLHVAKNFDELAVLVKNNVLLRDDSNSKTMKLFISPIRSCDDKRESYEKTGSYESKNQDNKFYPKIEKVDSNSRDFEVHNLSSSNSYAEQISKEKNVQKKITENKEKDSNKQQSSQENHSSVDKTAKFCIGNNSSKKGKSQTNENLSDKSSQFFNNEFTKNIAFSSMVNGQEVTDQVPENQEPLLLSESPLDPNNKNFQKTKSQNNLEKNNNSLAIVDENTNELSNISGFLNTDRKDIDKLVDIVNNELSPNNDDHSDMNINSISNNYSAVLDYKHNRSLETFYFEPNTIDLTCDQDFEIDISEEFERKPVITKACRPEEILQVPEINFSSLEKMKEIKLRKWKNNFKEYKAIELNFSNGKYIGNLDKITKLKTGLGIFHYNNGDSYEGYFVSDLKHGEGKYWFVNKDLYLGQFKNDLKSGDGVYYYCSGSRYFGTWKNDKRHGQGTFLFKSGAKYEGTFNDGKRDGYGTYTFASSKEMYIGQFKGNKYHGQGVQWSGVGQYRYEGEFVEGFFDGIGKEFNEAGKEAFLGKWKDGVKAGQNMLDKKNKQSHQENLLKMLDENSYENKEVLIKGKNVNLDLHNKFFKKNLEVHNPTPQNPKNMLKNKQTYSEAKQEAPKGLNKVKSTANLYDKSVKYPNDYKNMYKPKNIELWVEPSSLFSEEKIINNDTSISNSQQSNILNALDDENYKFKQVRDIFKKEKKQSSVRMLPKYTDILGKNSQSQSKRNLTKNNQPTIESKINPRNPYSNTYPIKKTTSTSPIKYQNIASKSLRNDRNSTSGPIKNIKNQFGYQKKSPTPNKNTKFKTEITESFDKNNHVSNKLEAMRRNKKEQMMEIIEKERTQAQERRSPRSYGRNYGTPNKD